MSIEENKELARRFVEEVHDQKKIEVIDEIIAAEYVSNDPNNSETFSRESLKDHFKRVFAAVPDLHVEVHQMVGEGNLVAVRETRSGTFKEKLGYLEPTGKHGSFSVFDMFRIEDGKIAECWWLSDTAAQQKILGIYGKA